MILLPIGADYRLLNSIGQGWLSCWKLMMLGHLTVGHLLVMIALCIPLRCYHFSIWSLVVLDALDAYELLYIALLTRQCIYILAL